MATWDELSSSKQTQLARQLCAGKHTPDNMNRAREALAENPILVRKTAKALGIEDEIDATEESTVEDSIDKMVTKTIPSPTQGESIRDYVTRLQKEIDKVDRGDDNDEADDPVFGPTKEREGEL
jgi:hypothetical protein